MYFLLLPYRLPLLESKMRVEIPVLFILSSTFSIVPEPKKLNKCSLNDLMEGCLISLCFYTPKLMSSVKEHTVCFKGFSKINFPFRSCRSQSYRRMLVPPKSWWQETHLHPNSENHGASAQLKEQACTGVSVTWLFQWELIIPSTEGLRTWVVLEATSSLKQAVPQQKVDATSLSIWKSKLSSFRVFQTELPK